MIADEVLIQSGVTKRKAREQWMARVFKTTPENVHQELNKIYRSRNRKKLRSIPNAKLPLLVQQQVGGIKAALQRGEIDEEGI